MDTFYRVHITIDATTSSLRRVRSLIESITRETEPDSIEVKVTKQERPYDPETGDEEPEA